MSFRVLISMVHPCGEQFISHATLSHLHSSGMVGRFPYERMPTRKIFAVAQKKAKIVAMEMAIESRMCHTGGSETSVRTNIVIGPNTGESDMPTDIVESGLVMIANIRNHGSIMIMEIGAMSCWASF